MRTLLVTGASSEIGQALILDQAAAFDRVIAHCNSNPERLERLRMSLNNRLSVVCADFSSEYDTRRMVEDLMEKEVCPTDIVHLPAGTFSLSNFHKVPWNAFEAQFDISLRSLVIILQAFLPKMSKIRNGRIAVMLSSVTSGVPPKYLSAYVTVKYAILGLIREISAEYAEKGISINGISPEMTDTKYLDHLPQMVKEMNREACPRKRLLTPKDIMPVFRLLLNEDSKAITGQNFIITDGK